MAKKIAVVITSSVLAATSVGVAAASATSAPKAPTAAAISTSYAKRVIRRYINREYTVALGPYFGACRKLAANTVRCEVQFKAGLYWRCGRVSVRNSGGYDYITARLPIGC